MCLSMQNEAKKDKIIEYLRKKGNKITPHRLGVIDILINLKKPLSAEEIFKKLKNVNLSTVYRILEWLAGEKVAQKISLEEDFDRYELSDKFSHHHHHFICTNCKKIKEIKCELVFKKREIENKNKVKINSHSIELFGKCGDCR